MIKREYQLLGFVDDRRTDGFELAHHGRGVVVRQDMKRANGNEVAGECSELFLNVRISEFYPAGAGIGHQIMIERGYVTPGSFVVASDSHSNMYGALGAVGTAIVRTDAAAVWATGEFWWQIPRTIQVVLEGNLPEGVSGKDVIITLCGLYNHDEALNAALEFSGPGVASLSMDARFSIANMSTEWDPIACWFPVDGVTIRYLENAHRKLQEQGVERFTEEDIEHWRKAPPQPDQDAVYSARITLDLSEVTPHISGPDTVQAMHSIAEIEKRKIVIQKAYLVSCVNSRLEDLEAAAWVLCGNKVADRVLTGAAQQRVRDAVWNLEHVDSVAELMALMEADVRRPRAAKAIAKRRIKIGKRSRVRA